MSDNRSGLLLNMYGRVELYRALFLIVFVCEGGVGFLAQTLVWTGGEFRVDCPVTLALMKQSGHYVKENVVAVKAASFKEEMFLLTPRMKRGVPATVCRLDARSGVAPLLSAYPELSAHAEGDCAAVQNAVDFYLDHLGLIWVLDIGIVDTMSNPRCTCPPKLVIISLQLHKITMTLDLADVVESTSILHTLAVEYGFGARPYAYVTDLSQSSVLVYDVQARTGYRMLLPFPPCRLEMALCRRAPAHQAVLLFTCQGSPGVYQVDTARLRRGDGVGIIGEVGDRLYPVTFLGSDVKFHTVYVSIQNCSNVVAWNLDRPYDAARLAVVHHGSRCCVRPTSVSVDPVINKMLILETNFGDFVVNSVGTGTFHRLTVVPKL